MDSDTLQSIGGRIGEMALPRWGELPGFGLYLDQVLLLLTQHLGAAADGEKTLTASMVNNYVKMGALPPPRKKKYYREHLAMLLVICVLKPVIPIGDVREYLSAELTAENGAALYDGFCDQYAGANAAVAAACRQGETPRRAMADAALRACAERTLAQTLLRQLRGKTEK